MEGTAEKLAENGLNNSATADECEDSSASDSEEKVVQEVDDAMLGSLQRGLNTISSHARAYMNTCTTEEHMKSMQDRLETSMLGLLKSEQVVKEIPMIVTSVVDKFVSDMEEEDASDDDKPLHAFKPLQKVNEEKMDQMSQKLFKLFQEKVNDYETSLTEQQLRLHPKFELFEKEVALSINAFQQRRSETSIVGAGDAFSDDETAIEKVIKYRNPDDLSDDESIIPTIDPLTKNPMINPVRNKYCNHVFEEKSVMNYIHTNTNPKCPLEYCRNSRLFEKDHFVKVPKLTEQVRRKNFREKDEMNSKLF